MVGGTDIALMAGERSQRTGEHPAVCVLVSEQTSLTGNGTALITERHTNIDESITAPTVAQSKYFINVRNIDFPSRSGGSKAEIYDMVLPGVRKKLT